MSLPSTPQWLRIAVAGVIAAVALATVASALRSPPKPEPLARAGIDGGTTVVGKADRDPAEPKSVRTIPISRLPNPTVEAPAVIAPVVMPDPPKVEAQQQEAPAPMSPRSNVCRRHGCYRVTTGRSWHCSCPKR